MSKFDLALKTTEDTEERLRPFYLLVYERPEGRYNLYGIQKTGCWWTLDKDEAMRTAEDIMEADDSVVSIQIPHKFLPPGKTPEAEAQEAAANWFELFKSPGND